MDADPAVVWISGSEPLQQREVARVTRELLRAGKYVFLRTTGDLWRRRVHEFPPVSRFFLTVDCSEPGDPRAKEAIRIARLSGFFTCVYTEVSSGTRMRDMEAVRDYVTSLYADGWVIVTSSPAGSVEHATLRRNAAEARKLVVSRRWRIFSEFVEAAVHARREPAACAEETLAATSAPEACEESAGAQ
jgi:organic radical activating enzyme